jgi:DNA-binding NtrC family response regulator
MQVLFNHPWKGNVRELKKAMEYAAVVAPDDRVEPYDLPTELGGAEVAGPAAVSPPATPVDTTPAFRPLVDEIRELERRRMTEALAAAGGVKTRAAQLIDMPIRTFTHKLKELKL